MTGVTLYQLSVDYQMLLQRLSDADLDATTIADTIDSTGLLDSFQDKAQNIEYVARSLEMFSPAIDAEIKRLKELKASRENKATALREYLKTNMVKCGIDRIDAGLFKIRIQANPPSVEVYEPGLITNQYMRQPPIPPPAPDKNLIARDLKLGMEVQGARLVQSTRLVVN